MTNFDFTYVSKGLKGVVVAGEILQIWTTYTLVLLRKKLCFMFDLEILFLCWPKTEVWYLALLKAKCTLQKSESLKTGRRRLKLSPRPSGAQVWSSDFLRPPNLFYTCFIFFTCPLSSLTYPSLLLSYLSSLWFSSPLFSQEAVSLYLSSTPTCLLFLRPSAHCLPYSCSTSYPSLGET